ncbi:UDP-N-acetylmuramate dehydrogenase [Zunongwangia sp. F363]|uniref:UDP-N-acetylenolpyruvoylglucosamine reductase n=1 Tax=Autumnicola tepida TaxID=3075595 RepID=A0ABU3CC23_9FLAO|nr:UDP-N-acetylmuramate dehydrogenase [Zunongwangia sp. F363]MDT0643876.1 UDP-N-acetylmuramate dehydrogenase [Zunongwangia sp. F363]
MIITNDQELKLYNSYRVASRCRRAFFPETEKDFVTIYRNYADRKKVILGGGFNVILSKPFYEEDFIIIGPAFSSSNIIDETIVEAEAGLDMKSLSELAKANSLVGLEIFYDIPSSLGGAVVMNAGASGIEIKDVLTKVRYLDLKDLQIKEILNEEIGFEYRNSFFQRNLDKIILKVWLRLKNGDPAKIQQDMERIKESRWAKQPKDFPNAGSVFKRPRGYYVGTMIEELGLKGLSIGGAQVSEKHAGFIVNYNNASGQDIIKLINVIQEKVWENYQVKLEVEQRII